MSSPGFMGFLPCPGKTGHLEKIDCLVLTATPLVLHCPISRQQCFKIHVQS